MPQQTDEEIARSVQKGQFEGFGLLVERYEQKLIRYARKFIAGPEDAKDIVQEVFIKAYKNIQSFDTDKAFSPWIYRIAHNEFVNAIKKSGREPISFFDPDTLIPHLIAKDKADDNLKNEELKKLVDGCLNQLDVKYREPLVLYFYEDLDYKAISEIMHIPVSTVGIRIKRAKEQLQTIYQSLNHKL